MPRAAALLALLVLLALPAGASAANYAPPAGKVLQGGTGGYGVGSIRDFARLSGRHPSVYQYFFTPTWNRSDERAARWQAGLLDTSRRAGVRTMFALSTARGGYGRALITPGGIARGEGDGYLIRLGELIAASGQVVYVRLMAEMNNWNNPYSAFNANGSRRGKANTTQAFRQAFRRAALVLRGGEVAGINRRLRRLRLPPVRTGKQLLAQPQVALLWVPFCAGLPHVRGNGPGAYWPGRAYVDWVGTDFFANSPNFRCLERLYRAKAWRRKPFVFGEWALWGRDDPAFVRRLFRWIRGHRRVRAVVYNQGATFKPLLRLRPRAVAELRRQLQGSRFELR